MNAMRKFIAMLAICGVLIGYIVIAATIGSKIAHAPIWLQTVFYIIAGIGWALPIMPIMWWAERGGKS